MLIIAIAETWVRDSSNLRFRVNPRAFFDKLKTKKGRERPEHHVMVGQVNREPVEPVRNRRAGRTPCFVVGPGHEMIDEQLRASSEEVCKRSAPLVGLEAVFLVGSNPRQFLPFSRQFIATAGQFLLGFEQLQPGRKPLFTCSSLMISHRFLSPFLFCNSIEWSWLRNFQVFIDL